MACLASLPAFNTWGKGTPRGAMYSSLFALRSPRREAQ
jgi:hypothetical protein